MDEADKAELIEFGISALEELEETDMQYTDVRRATIGELSKLLVYNGFRNGPIENIHAGEHMEIPDNVSRISNEEMAYLMKTATTEIAKLLEWFLLKPEIIAKLTNASTFMSVPKYWEDPNWSEIDDKNARLAKLHEE